MVSAHVVINEIMYAPNNSIGGTTNEWIELFFINNTNIENYTLVDEGTPNKTTNLNGTFSEDSYLIIARNSTKFCEFWNCSSLSVIEGKFILNNEGNKLFLYNNDSIIDYMYYNKSLGWLEALGNNSLQKINSTGNSSQDNWCVATPTPGVQNNCTQEGQQEEAINLTYPQEVECNKNFSILVSAHNFDDGIYDVKIDIKDIITDDRIGKVWNGTKWISTIYYVNNALEIINGTGKTNLTFKIEDFSGEAYLVPSIRDLREFGGDYSLIIICGSQEDEEESEIEIVDAPDEARFGSTIEVEIEVYKGKTDKYAVYIYVEDDNNVKVSDKVTLHFYEKFSDYDETVELELKCKNESGIYEIVAKGLDTEDRKDIELSPCTSDSVEGGEETEGVSIGDFTYSLTIPNTIKINEEFNVKIKIVNKGSKEQEFLVWSYVYRGPKCYSCSDGETRESNAKEIIVKAGSTAQVILTNTVKETEPGTYKLKVKVLQEGLKTAKEFTYDITLQSSIGTEPKTEESKTAEPGISTGAISEAKSDYSQSLFNIIESNSFLINKTMPYFLATISLLFVIYLIIKKI